MKSKLLAKAGSIIPASILYAITLSCSNNNHQADAYGNFEADEIMVSAQSQGEILLFSAVEGTIIEKNQVVGRVDSTQPALKMNQLLAQQNVIHARMQNIDWQLKVQDEQRVNLVREVDRMQKLLKENAATQQQYDDVSGKLKVLDSQTEAIRSQKKIILGELSVLKVQLEETRDMLDKCRIISPINGIVLEIYVNQGELVTPGKALFKIADISEMELKVYVSGSQLPSVVLGDTVVVFIDSANGELQKIPGIISWVSSQIEFTPKIIQTRDERVNMVYAVKIRVKNDGRLKIGMPGEVVLKSEQ